MVIGLAVEAATLQMDGLAVKEYTTLYAPAVEADKLIKPVEASIDKPDVEAKVPPVLKPATSVGKGFTSLAHTAKG